MEQKEVIKRIPSPKDKRANIITITEKGKTQEKNAQMKISQLESQMIKSLTKQEQKELQVLLTKIEQNLKEREK